MVKKLQKRLQQKREHITRIREQETQEEKKMRQKKDQLLHSRTREKKSAIIQSMEELVHSFEMKVKEGPSYVCTCCHRLL